MAVDITPGAGKTVSCDVFGTPTNIAAGQQTQFVAIGSGVLGALALNTAGNPSFFTVVDASGNKLPSMDVVARKGFVSITDGVNTMPTMDALARPGFVKVTDGTNTQVTFDVVARRGFVQFSDGTNSQLSASAANIAALSSINANLVTGPGQWVVTHAPLVNVKATATKAAGAAGVRHVCTGVSFTLTQSVTGGTPFTGTVNLIDGASGGAAIATWNIGVQTAACSGSNFALSGLNIPGTAATAMTLEFTAVGGLQTLESVVLTGYDTV